MIYQIAVINGSLRKASIHAGLLRTIITTNDKRFKFDWVNIYNFPMFNEDIEVKGIPLQVQTARDIVSKSHAMLFGVPQYNHTISAPLKNAYDWLSRYDKNKHCPVSQKPGAMISAGFSMGGGRAQNHFRQCVEYKKVVLLTPSKNAQFLLKLYNGKYFNQNGDLIDQEIRNKKIPIFLDQFYQFLRNYKK